MTAAAAPDRLPPGMRVLEVAGLPPGVEVRASRRRRRTVTAYREAGRTVLLVPARMSRSDIVAYARDLVGRLEARERRSTPSDAALLARATELSARYLDGRAVPASVRWAGNQRRRWGSCTPVDSSIRLSDRLTAMPGYVIDYVLLHELAHLLVAGHGPRFDALLTPYPRLAEAQAFLAGVDHAWAAGSPAADTPPAAELDRPGRVDPTGPVDTLW